MGYPPQPAPQPLPTPTLSVVQPPPRKKAKWPYCLGAGCLVLIVALAVAAWFAVSFAKKRPEVRAAMRIAKETNCRITGVNESISNTEDKLELTLAANYDPQADAQKLHDDLTKVQRILVEEGWTSRRQVVVNVQGVNTNSKVTYTFNTADMQKTFGGTGGGK